MNQHQVLIMYTRDCHEAGRSAIPPEEAAHQAPIARSTGPAGLLANISAVVMVI